MSEQKKLPQSSMAAQISHTSIVACGTVAGGVSGAGICTGVGMVLAGPPGAAIGYMLGTIGGLLSGAVVTHKAAKFTAQAMS